MHKIRWMWAPALPPSLVLVGVATEASQRVRLVFRGSAHKQGAPLRIRKNFTTTICTQDVAVMSLARISDSQELQMHMLWPQKEFIRVYELASSTRIH